LVSANNTLCLILWGTAAAAPIHALHFGFGIGAFIAPLLARPFIGDNSTSNSTSPDDDEVDSPIEIPYAISAILCAVWFAIFLCFYIHSRMTQQKDKKSSGRNVEFGGSWKRMLSPGSCTNGDITFGVLFFALLFLFYTNIVGGERAYGKFIYSYATDSDLKFSNDEASLLNSLFWICFTCGRGVSIIAAKFVSPKLLLGVELFFNTVACVVLAVWADEHAEVLWVFTGLLGFFLSPVFAAGMAFAHQYIKMTGTAVALVFVGSSAGGMVYQYLTGYLFENHGAQSLMYVMVGYALALTAVFVCLFLIVRRRTLAANVNEDGSPVDDVAIKSVHKLSEDKNP
jgi:FHS family Na+ dependent glucose MFS transporter 1